MCLCVCVFLSVCVFHWYGGRADSPSSVSNVYWKNEKNKERSLGTTTCGARDMVNVWIDGKDLRNSSLSNGRWQVLRAADASEWCNMLCVIFICCGFQGNVSFNWVPMSRTILEMGNVSSFSNFSLLVSKGVSTHQLRSLYLRVSQVGRILR